MLKSQLLELPIVGGVNQKEDAVLTRRPTAMVNCVHRKSGAVSKRYGMTCVGLYNLRTDATTPSTCEMLATYADELVRVGAGQLDTFKVVNATSDWVYRDRCPEVAITKEAIATVGRTASVFTDPDIGIANGYSITAYIAVSTGSSTTCQVCVDVTDTTTGARVLSRYVVATASTALLAPRVAATGTSVGVFWYDLSATTVKGRFLNLSTLVWAATANVWPGVASSKFDVGIVSASEYVLGIETSSGANRIGIVVFAPTITAGAFDVSTTLALATADTGVTALALRVVPGSRIWLAYAKYGGGNYEVKVATITAAYANELAATTVSGSVASATNTVRSVGIEQVSAGLATCTWAVDLEDAFWINITSAGAYPFTPVNRLYAFGWLSKPFLRGGRMYALGFNVHATHGTQFLIDLDQSAIGNNAVARYAAVALPRQLGGILLTSIPRLNSLSSVVASATDDYLIATLALGQQEDSFTVHGLRVRFDAQWVRTAAETASVLVLGGGVPSVYDGTQVFEAAFAHEPDVDSVASFTSGAGGSLLASTLHSYKFVFVFNDARGNVYRSAPSLPKTCTTSVGHGTVSGNVPQLRLTNHVSSSDPGVQVSVEMYRAVSAVYYLVDTYTNRPDYGSVAFSDTASNATISANRTLYTEGDVLDHVTPPSATIVHVWKGAAFLAGTDDGKIWISGEAVEDEGPWFNDTLVIEAFEGGEVTALSSLDACLVIFKAEGIWYVQGEPPTDLGASSLTAPQRVQVDVGCSDPRSIVRTADGILFASRYGIYLLNRALQVVPVGKPVEDSYAANGFVGAVTLPNQSLVRFVQRATTAAALNLDTYHSAQFGAPVWSRDDYVDPIDSDTGSGDLQYPVAALMWRGTFTWISAAGYVYQESTSSFLDTAGALTSWVAMSLTTGVEKVAGVQGLQRVRHVSVLGKRITPHAATVAITVDGGGEQSRVWSAADTAALPATPNSTLSVHVARQKGQWISVTFTDADPVSSRGTGEGLTLRSIALDVGVKRGLGASFGASRKR